MSYEWLIILGCLIFLIGWLAGRADIRHIRKTACEIPDAVLRGLAHLLANEEQKALENFLSAPQTGSQPQEFQFAVGELLRRRGEHKRALELHRRLFESENLSPAARHRALWALAQDYQNMGFVDLAQKHAEPLLQEPAHADAAFLMLLTIYQQKRQYQEALRLVEASGEDKAIVNRVMLAQWHCEFAEAEEDDEAARAHIKAALAKNPQCARANLALAERALAAGEAGRAAELLQETERQNPQTLWLAVAPLARACEGNPEKWRRIVTGWLQRHPSALLLQAVCEGLPPQEAQERAEAFLQNRAGARAAAIWAQTQTQAQTPVWRGLTRALQEAAGKRFVCERCDYGVNEFSWQCRGCLAWETLRERP